MKLSAKLIGAQHRAMGYSIHYNPFRHKGEPQDYLDWILGWEQCE